MKEKVKKSERESEEKEQARRTEIEMKTLKKEQLKRARQLFYGSSTMANFTAWKKYTVYIINKRAEDRKKYCRRLKWTVAIVLLLVGLVYGTYVTVMSIQEENRKKQAQAAQEIAEEQKRQERQRKGQKGGTNS